MMYFPLCGHPAPILPEDRIVGVVPLLSGDPCSAPHLIVPGFTYVVQIFLSLFSEDFYFTLSVFLI